MSIRRRFPNIAIVGVLLLYTAYILGPIIWLASMSVRTTAEINTNHFALPESLHLSKFREAWTGSNYESYFSNSLIVVGSSVALLTVFGSMAAYCLARYRFPGNRIIFLALFSTIMLPPQITIIALFQVMVEYRLFNSLTGLVAIYVATQLPLTIYLLESFFARIPQDLLDAAKIDGYSDFEIFWRIAFPLAMPAVVTTALMNFILLWNEFLYAVLFLVDESKRTLPLGIQKFMGDQFSDIGMIATGAMISIIPVIILYGFFSEKIIKGMTAGALK